jgi:undecaprenyl-diphosphatase
LSILESIILGIVQGLSEFLPISSSAHLTLAGKMMNVVSKEHPEHWTAFIAVIQLGTLISVLIYFSKDIINITSEFIRDNIKLKLKYREQSFYSRLGWMIAIGTIPIVIIGLGFKDIIEGSLTKNLYVISLSLIIFAIVLAISERVAEHKRDIKDLTIKDTLIIGIAQSFALIPGASRSGTTITGGLFVGLKRSDAARFSFLLSIPAVFASGLLELNSALKYIDASMMLNFAVATLASAVSGYIAIDFLIKYLKKHSTYIFIFYRIALGILIIVLLLTNTFKP